LDINLCAVSRQSKGKHDVTPPRRRSLALKQGPRQDWNSDQRHANTQTPSSHCHAHGTATGTAPITRLAKPSNLFCLSIPSHLQASRPSPARWNCTARSCHTPLWPPKNTRHSLPTCTQISRLICRYYGYMEYCNSSIARP
jgi:hypothetical protein